MTLMNKVMNENDLCPPLHSLSIGFTVQEANFVRFIALNEWATFELRPEKEGWVSVSDLYNKYCSWVDTTPTIWNRDCVDNRIGFSKKLSQLFSAKGISFALTRKRGERGFSGITIVNSHQGIEP